MDELNRNEVSESANVTLEGISPTSSVQTPSPRPEEAQSSPKKKRNGVWFAVAAILLALCTATAFLAGYWANAGTTVFEIPRNGSPTYAVATPTEGEEMTAAQVIEKVTPSVVVIKVSITDSASGRIGTGFGTGIIYTDNCYILTNAHVIEDANNITVQTYDEKTYRANIIGYDTTSDVAVLKIDATDLTPAVFGDSSTLVPGAEVIAIGTPYSLNLSYTSTKGIVSAIRNNFSFPELNTALDLIQHDAAINSGNSGGPLLNMYGQVIGINSIKISGTYENLGFALQINTVIPLMEQLMNTGTVSRPAIGIQGSTESNLGGVLVANVISGGAADQAGLQAGDLITKMDGTRINSIEELKKMLGEKKVGDQITLTVIRDGEIMDFQLTLQQS